MVHMPNNLLAKVNQTLGQVRDYSFVQKVTLSCQSVLIGSGATQLFHVGSWLEAGWLILMVAVFIVVLELKKKEIKDQIFGYNDDKGII